MASQGRAAGCDIRPGRRQERSRRCSSAPEPRGISIGPRWAVRGLHGTDLAEVAYGAVQTILSAQLEVGSAEIFEANWNC